MRGQVKPLMPFRGRSFVLHAAGELMASNISELVIVTGAAHHLVDEELSRLEYSESQRSFHIEHNPDFRRGMLSSIQTGVKKFSREINAFLVCLLSTAMIFILIL